MTFILFFDQFFDNFLKFIRVAGFDEIFFCTGVFRFFDVAFARQTGNENDGKIRFDFDHLTAQIRARTVAETTVHYAEIEIFGFKILHRFRHGFGESEFVLGKQKPVKFTGVFVIFDAQDFFRSSFRIFLRNISS